MIKVIIFDMDGTIVDTDEVLRLTWYKVFEKFYNNKHYVSDDVIKTFSGPSLKETINKYFPNFSFNEVKDVYSNSSFEYYEKYANVFPDELEVLKKLKDDGYKLAVFTNKNKERALYCLNKLSLNKYFSYLVSGDDVKHNKPNKEGIDKILNYYKIKTDEAILIGDTIYDYNAAFNGDIKCILLKVASRIFPKNLKSIGIYNTYMDLYKGIKEYDN